MAVVWHDTDVPGKHLLPIDLTNVFFLKSDEKKFFPQTLHNHMKDTDTLWPRAVQKT